MVALPGRGVGPGRGAQARAAADGQARRQRRAVGACENDAGITLTRDIGRGGVWHMHTVCGTGHRRIQDRKMQARGEDAWVLVYVCGIWLRFVSPTQLHLVEPGSMPVVWETSHMVAAYDGGLCKMPSLCPSALKLHFQARVAHPAHSIYFPCCPTNHHHQHRHTSHITHHTSHSSPIPHIIRCWTTAASTSTASHSPRTWAS